MANSCRNSIPWGSPAERQRGILALLEQANDGLTLREFCSLLAPYASMRQVRRTLAALRGYGAMSWRLPNRWGRHSFSTWPTCSTTGTASPGTYRAAKVAGVEAISLAQEAEALLDRFPNAALNADEQRRLRAALYHPLLALEGAECLRIVEIMLKIMLDNETDEYS